MESHTGSVVYGDDSRQLRLPQLQHPEGTTKGPACSRLLRIGGLVVSSLSISLAILSCCALCGLVHLESMKEELFQDQSLQFYTVFHRHLGVQAPRWVVFLLNLERAAFNPCHHTSPCGQPFSTFIVRETYFSTFT